MIGSATCILFLLSFILPHGLTNGENAIARMEANFERMNTKERYLRRERDPPANKHAIDVTPFYNSYHQKLDRLSQQCNMKFQELNETKKKFNETMRELTKECKKNYKKCMVDLQNLERKIGDLENENGQLQMEIKNCQQNSCDEDHNPTGSIMPFLEMEYFASSTYSTGWAADKAVQGGNKYWCSKKNAQLPVYWWISFQKVAVEIVSIAFEEKHEGAEFQFIGSDKCDPSGKIKVLISGTQADINEVVFENGKSYQCYGLKMTKRGNKGYASLKNFHFNSRTRHCQETKCNGHGQCHDYVTGYNCVCQKGFIGKDCKGAFEASKDAKGLYKAFKGYTSDWWVYHRIIPILTSRTTAQLQEIQTTFNKRYSPSYHLHKWLRHDLEKGHCEVIEAKLLGGAKFLAQEVAARAARPIGSTLAQDICASNVQLIIAMEDISNLNTDALFKDFLKALHENRRTSSSETSAAEDAHALARTPTPTQAWIDILSTRSRDQLRVVFGRLEKVTKMNVEDFIRGLTSASDDFKACALAIAYTSRYSAEHYWAKALNEAISRGDKASILRVVVGRSEIDLGMIRRVYDGVYKRTMMKAIDYSGLDDTFKFTLKSLIQAALGE